MVEMGTFSFLRLSSVQIVEREGNLGYAPKRVFITAEAVERAQSRRGRVGFIFAYGAETDRQLMSVCRLLPPASPQKEKPSRCGRKEGSL